MERAEKIGLGVAGAGHLILFGLLSIGFLSTPNPLKLQQQPIDVSLVKEVGLEATAPQAVEPPAQSVAPDTGEPEDAAPPAPMEAAPEPVPAPAAKPAPPPKPAPVARPKPPEPAPTKAPPKPARPAKAATAAKTPPAETRGNGSTADSKAARPRGSRLGANFLKGLTDQASKSTSQTPRAAKLDSRALASIVQAIARQIQPCADRQVTTGMPGANEIVTVLNLRLNQDGTLAATPRMVRQTGVDDGNSRYAQRAADLGVAAFKACSPLQLPAEFYHTPAGGWDNINYQWQLR